MPVGGDIPSYDELKERLARVKERERIARDWQTTFDAISDVVWILDLNNRIVRSNQAAVQLFEREISALLGKHCWEILHGTREPAPECPIVRMHRSRQRETSNFQLGKRWFKVTADPILDAENNLTGAVHIVSDITKRMHAEQALRESEEKFKHEFESANVGKSITLTTGELYVNKAFADLLGYSREELTKKTWQELTPPEDIELIQEILATLLNGEKNSARFNKRYLHSNGSLVWADVSTVIRRGEDSHPLYFITTLVDITERKRTEDLLHLSEKRFYHAFHSSPAGLTITRLADGKFVDVNESFLRMFEFTRDEVIGHTSTTLEMWTPEERQYLIQKQMESSGLNDFELQARAKSGRGISILFSSNLMELEGDPHLITTMLDITERKRAQNDLIEIEGRYRSLFENMTAGFVLFEVVQDVSGVPVDLIIIAANKGFEITTGLKAQDVTGKRLTRVLPGIEKDDADWIGTYGKIALTGKSQQFEQGSELLGHYYFVNAYQSGPKQCAVTFLDISDQKKAEADRDRLQEQLFQSQKLESIGRLAGGVAHDFNNMLSVIIGYGENVLEQLHQGDPMREEVKEIVAAGRRSAALTRQLLAFSRKQTLQPEVLDLNDVIHNLEKMLHRLIGEDIELELALAQDISRVLVDPGQVEQVIMNLAINARDAMPEGGKLLIETAETELGQTYAEKHPEVTPGNYVLLAMTDTGCGIPNEFMDKVFEPFFTTKEEGKGTGLGLAMVYGIVKQSGGNIWVYSESSQGTTFKIYLPRTEAKHEPVKRKAVGVNRKGGGEHILAVEDEETLRRFIGTLLPRLGYKVTLAANGGEALLLIEEKGLQPDLLLTDVVMPNMSGKQLVARLRMSRPDLKVLYMSGYTDNSIVHHGVLDPDTPFLQKPFTMNQIAAKIREVLSS